ncbi:nucleoside triphosphate pyrophosphohydrolase [Leptolyngbya sp. FACHB-261]|uniref:nucleoside triphosphate pyrophosphohydrolase n=1 Tax=Leptolyngbya sp. FACHB-261 TaxID=2692806 RepID=UPI001681E223|nr:nucleoside triphosphate pyrophosphohydrolase [Leptolyngbya sp. FACHB-261]MBD2105305.1 nucleoside triphosphate pyrophosphohydrolase [Leptolyngbya sp. FACHB-261]
MKQLAELIEIVARLRAPDGCPWDRAQTPLSLTPYVVEEAYEVVDAIQQGDPEAIADELGDLLLQVVLQAQIASEMGQFNLDTVAEKICAKLIRRHPHVFGTVSVSSPEEVQRNWQQIKAAEKGESEADRNALSRKLDRYARTMPPLLAALKISVKAAEAGFEWDDMGGVWAKFEEELQEFREALTEGDLDHMQAELGDLLFTVVNLARWSKLDPSDALQGTNRRFVQRLQLMEQVAERPLEEYTLAELEGFWQQAKARLRHGSEGKGSEARNSEDRDSEDKAAERKTDPT